MQAGGSITFNAPGTWTTPARLLRVNVEGRGGDGNPGNSGTGGNGGAGGTGNSGNAGGGGGGGNSGETDIEYFTAEVSFKYTIYNITDMKGNRL